MSESIKESQYLRITWKINLVGIWLLLILLAQVAGGVYTWLYLDKTIIRALLIIGLSGGLGATVYCLRGFYQHIGLGDFNTQWTWWYIVRPFLGVVMGVFLYFFVNGGLLVMSDTPVNGIEAKGLMFYASLAFVAGITFTRFMEKIYSIGEAMFASKPLTPSSDALKSNEKDKSNDTNKPCETTTPEEKK